MKVVIVTSQITYVPKNYLGLLEKVILNDQNRSIYGLIILENLDKSVVKSALKLYLVGARKIASQLLKNIFSLRKMEREILFKNHQREVVSFKSMNDPEAIEWLKKNDIDLVVNARTRCIYKKMVLSAPRLGCINIHHGLLPEYRGTLCDLYALTEGRNAGFSIHEMTSKIDAGTIYKKIEVSNSEKDYLNYLDMAQNKEGEALIELIREIEKLNHLPTGIPNQCANPIFTKNPTLKQIRYFLKKGFRL